jgi:hypothetical protein
MVFFASRTEPASAVREINTVRMIIALHSLLFAIALLVISTAAAGQVAISVSFGPPPLPVYEQPLCPGEGYIWTPGYWAWDADFDDYYWVPGTWVLAPEVGLLWTPPWWGWDNGVYIFHEGWWGPEVGFYGGIYYGFGYFGTGYVGGRWEGNQFYYNRSVTNINVVNIRNVYNEHVTVRNENHVSYNGGPEGVRARPRPEEEAAARRQRTGPVAAQTQDLRAARGNPELRATANHGKPPIAATARPGEFRGGGAVSARAAGGAYHPPANRASANRAGSPENRGHAPVHPNDLPPVERPAHPNTGNPRTDQKYQQQQEKLFNRQNQEREQLQRRQEQEHQRLQPSGGQERQQQMEQRHQQQTQQLQQRHAQQQQRLEQRYPRK